MNAFAYTDAKCVLGACKAAKNIKPMKPVLYEDKLFIATYTGLSLSQVEKALTNIRKGILRKESI